MMGQEASTKAEEKLILLSKAKALFCPGSNLGFKSAGGESKMIQYIDT